MNALLSSKSGVTTEAVGVALQRCFGSSGWMWNFRVRGIPAPTHLNQMSGSLLNFMACWGSDSVIWFNCVGAGMPLKCAHQHILRTRVGGRRSDYWKKKKTNKIIAPIIPVFRKWNHNYNLNCAKTEKKPWLIQCKILRKIFWVHFMHKYID